MCTRQSERGLTLIELIVFIVIISVALAGVLSVLNFTTRHSPDPMIRKQALAIAEALMEEVQSQPFTWCDPDDTKAGEATSYTDGKCTALENNLAPEADELRGSNTTPYDNVNDYNGLSTTTNAAGQGNAPYLATVSVTNHDLNAIPSDAALLITVSVTAGNETIEIQGYRTRHSPNLLP